MLYEIFRLMYHIKVNIAYKNESNIINFMRNYQKVISVVYDCFPMKKIQADLFLFC